MELPFVAFNFPSRSEEASVPCWNEKNDPIFVFAAVLLKNSKTSFRAVSHLNTGKRNFEAKILSQDRPKKTVKTFDDILYTFCCHETFEPSPLSA